MYFLSNALKQRFDVLNDTYLGQNEAAIDSGIFLIRFYQQRLKNNLTLFQF